MQALFQNKQVECWELMIDVKAKKNHELISLSLVYRSKQHFPDMAVRVWLKNTDKRTRGGELFR